ncbi:MAG: HAD family hydrolase [Ruminococcaceae bacterium]|nr:HAD family hydrolase [Oscillospiraceae bacterium]
MEKKVIFWDFDGTLIHPNQSFLCSLSAAMEQHGYSFEEQVLKDFLASACSWYSPEREYPHRTGELWWEDLLDALRGFCAENGVSGDDARSVCAQFRRNVTDFDYRLYDDAREVLARCGEIGFENYILSNNFPELTQVVERFGLDRYVSGRFLSSEIGYEKPRAEIFLHALAAVGNPEVCYMVGDNPVADIQGGREAGLRTVLVHGSDADCGADFVCGELTEIVGLLQA